MVGIGFGMGDGRVPPGMVMILQGSVEGYGKYSN